MDASAAGEPGGLGVGDPDRLRRASGGMGDGVAGRTPGGSPSGGAGAAGMAGPGCARRAALRSDDGLGPPHPLLSRKGSSVKDPRWTAPIPAGGGSRCATWFRYDAKAVILREGHPLRPGSSPLCPYMVAAEAAPTGRLLFVGRGFRPEPAPQWQQRSFRTEESLTRNIINGNRSATNNQPAGYPSILLCEGEKSCICGSSADAVALCGSLTAQGC